MHCPLVTKCGLSALVDDNHGLLQTVFAALSQPELVHVVTSTFAANDNPRLQVLFKYLQDIAGSLCCIESAIGNSLADFVFLPHLTVMDPGVRKIINWVIRILCLQLHCFAVYLLYKYFEVVVSCLFSGCLFSSCLFSGCFRQRRPNWIMNVDIIDGVRSGFYLLDFLKP